MKIYLLRKWKKILSAQKILDEVSNADNLTFTQDTDGAFAIPIVSDMDGIIIAFRRMLFPQFQLKFWCSELMMVNMQKLKF